MSDASGIQKGILKGILGTSATIWGQHGEQHEWYPLHKSHAGGTQKSILKGILGTWAVMMEAS